MPGIVGIIGLNKQVASFEVDFKNMVKSLVYNENDLVKIIQNETHFLGVVNINDGRNKEKYFVNRDESIICLIDGDVFVGNDIKRKIAKKSDLSASNHGQAFVPYLYKEFKFDFIKYIKGWFNIFIVDKKEHKYHMVNSRFGMRPLYYAQVNEYFLFSSELKSLMKSSLVKKEIKQKSVIDYALFNYPLGKETYIRNVFVLDPATFITVNGSKIKHITYWKPEVLFSDTLLSRDESLAQAENILKKTVNEMHEDSGKVGVAVTGGFDSRTVLSLIDKDKENLLLYSFGIPESGDIKVPKKISEQLSYDYLPIYLDDNYGVHLFHDYARKTILFSDGRSSLARAHYLYASHLLSKKVKVVLTGNCGSELLRAVHLTGEVISDNTKSIFLNNVSKGMEDIFNNPLYKKYYNKSIFDKVRSSIFDSIKNIMKVDDCELKPNQRFYVFLLKEVFRKYFGTEISMESPFLYNRSPYLDYDFVDFIFKTPFCGANYDFFEQNPFARIQGQQFYSHIIAKNNENLAKLNTSRMYAPHNLLTNSGKIKAGLTYFYRKFFVRKKDEYNLNLGLHHFMQNSKEILKDNECIDMRKVMDDYNNGNWQKNKIEFYKALSFAVWFNHNVK
jgi:asparagine synthetase B (glutamine-hydrolysing)